jgi:hypothetical protein
MVNCYNNKNGGKKEQKKQKSASKVSPTSPDLSCGCVFVVKGWLGGMVKWKGRSVG